MEDWNQVKEFWDYLEYYPCEDEPEYDGVHNGDIKGIQSSAPESAKKAFEKWFKNKHRAESEGIKI